MKGKKHFPLKQESPLAQRDGLRADSAEPRWETAVTVSRAEQRLFGLRLPSLSALDISASARADCTPTHLSRLAERQGIGWGEQFKKKLVK